jgi:hypothetical protein
LLVTAPTLALAECAWVLWSLPTRADIDAPIGNPRQYADLAHWTPAEAFATRAAWEERHARVVADRWLFFMQAIEDARKRADKPRLAEDMLYRCLPDTVDPRGPKR